VGEHVFLKVKDNISSLKLENYSKLVARYCGPFEILKRIGPIAYMIALHESMSIHNVFHVSLHKKHIHDDNNVIDWNVIQWEKESAFQVHLVCIMDQKIKHLWNRSIGLVMVQSTWYGIEDMTLDHEYVMWEEYPHIFEYFENLVDVM
jgi:hypothetical protein